MIDLGRVLLLGANGQVGVELQRSFAGADLVALDRSRANLNQPESLRSAIREAAPAVILNAAAYTAVDRAESEPELADTVNHKAVRVIAEEAERVGALLVHYSTDYVFDGSKQAPWVETDTPAPLNVYGQTKLDGERAVAAVCSRYLTLRTSWVYSAHGHNFMKTMLRLGQERARLTIVNDQHGAPTSAGALADATRALVQQAASQENTEWAGLYHATCGGATTWAGFAKEIFAVAANGKSPQIVGIASVDYPTPATRPAYSVLSAQKLLERWGLALPHWQSALKLVLSERSRLQV